MGHHPYRDSALPKAPFSGQRGSLVTLGGGALGAAASFAWWQNTDSPPRTGGLTTTTPNAPPPNGRPTAQRRRRVAVRWWRDPILAGLPALSLVMLAWSASGRASIPAAVRLGTALTIVTEVTQVILAIQVCRLPASSRSARLFYRLLAASGVMFMIATSLQLPVAIRDPYHRAIALGVPMKNGFIAAGAAFLIAALVTSPLGPLDRGQRARFWLDGMTIMIAVAVYAWGFSDLSRTSRAGESVAQQFAHTVIGPAAFLAVVFGTLKLLLGGTPIFTYQAGALAAIAGALQGLAMALIEPLTRAGNVPLLICFGLAATTGFMMSVRTQLLQARADPGLWRPRPRRTSSPLPAAAVVAAHAMLIAVLAADGLSRRAWIFLIAAMASTAAIIVRMFMAFADISRLRRQLAATAGTAHHEPDRDSGELRSPPRHEAAG